MKIPPRPASDLYPPHDEPASCTECGTCNLKTDQQIHSEVCSECCDHTDRDSHCCMTCGIELAEHDTAAAEFHADATKDP